MSKILKILNNRITYITVLFGAFGGALSLLLKIEEMKTYYPALATLIALLVSLLVSLLIKGKRTNRIRQQFKIVAAVLFIMFLVSTVVHTHYIINDTFQYHEFDQVNRYVKGEYSDSGLAVKKRYPLLNDEEILYKKMDGTDGIRTYWTPVSIDNNIFMLIITYCAVVLFFVSCITFLIELLSEDDKKPQRKIKKPPAIV